MRPMRPLLIFQAMPELNWAGFYFLRSPQELSRWTISGQTGLRACASQWSRRVRNGVLAALHSRHDVTESRTTSSAT